MPQVFKIGGYVIYFWLDEGKPLEPVHVHVAEGVPQENATKIWLTQSGKAIIANNRSAIPEKDLRKLIRLIEANFKEICRKWSTYFERLDFYC